jgi:hypothetical protein
VSELIHKGTMDGNWDGKCDWEAEDMAIYGYTILFCGIHIFIPLRALFEQYYGRPSNRFYWPNIVMDQPLRNSH